MTNMIKKIEITEDPIFKGIYNISLNGEPCMEMLGQSEVAGAIEYIMSEEFFEHFPEYKVED